MFDQGMEFISWCVAWLWSIPTFFILMGAGIGLTLWSRFTQFTALTHGVQVIRGIYDDPNDPGAINHFQALSAALSATVGLGNITGVALAMGIGGPGALVYMWAIGFLGMAIKTVEITLAMMYRNTEDPENPHGGAMWVIHKTLGSKGGGLGKLAKALGGFFCLTLLVSTITGGNLFQSWSVADLTNLYFGVPQFGTGVLLSILVGLVIIGGIKRIGNVAGKLVPVMCILYIVAAVGVIVVNLQELPALIALILRSAVDGTEATGAFLGGGAYWAFTIGLRRALFSNEAGQGSAPIAHAAAKTNEPAREGIVGGIGPFIDTLVICTLTAMVILSTDTWKRGPLGEVEGRVDIVNGELIAPVSVDALPAPPAGESWHVGSSVFFLVQVDEEDRAGTVLRRVFGRIAADGKIEWDDLPAAARWTQGDDGRDLRAVFRDYKGATLTSHAFDRAFPGLGKWLVTLAAWLFAISTMISWSYYGEQGVIFLFGQRWVLGYKILFCILIVVAPVAITTDAQLLDLADFGTGWQLWANMPIVLIMGHLAIRSLQDYKKRLKAGQFPRRS